MININATTLVHKDSGDSGGCIILTIGDHRGGGEIGSYEPKLVFETRNGDFTVFHSNFYSHYNLHYVGKRASIIIHGDKRTVADQNNSCGGWARNQFFAG